MDIASSIGVLLGSSWASGFNLYLCMAGLGISHRMDWISLPGDLTVLAHPLIIAFAVVMFVVEFVADKIPYFDSVWDSIHTFIRPTAGAAMGYLAMSNASPVLQVPVALLAGSIAMESHVTKAATRLAINTSPEPFSNSAASVTEDLTVVGLLYLMIQHPIIASLVVIAFIILSVWVIKILFRFVKKVFRLFFRSEKPEPQVQKI